MSCLITAAPSDLNCPVCWEPLDNSKVIIAHDSENGKKHPWHLDCVLDWLSNHPECMCCKEKISQKSIKKIFHESLTLSKLSVLVQKNINVNLARYVGSLAANSIVRISAVALAHIFREKGEGPFFTGWNLFEIGTFIGIVLLELKFRYQYADLELEPKLKPILQFIAMTYLNAGCFVCTNDLMMNLSSYIQIDDTNKYVLMPSIGAVTAIASAIPASIISGTLCAAKHIASKYGLDRFTQWFD